MFSSRVGAGCQWAENAMPTHGTHAFMARIHSYRKQVLRAPRDPQHEDPMCQNSPDLPCCHLAPAPAHQAAAPNVLRMLCLRWLPLHPTSAFNPTPTNLTHLLALYPQVQKSRIVFAENSPRWGDKFDFVMITAGSTLHLTVTDKSAGFAGSIISTATGVFGKKKKEEVGSMLAFCGSPRPGLPSISGVATCSVPLAYHIWLERRRGRFDGPALLPAQIVTHKVGRKLSV